MHWEAPGTARAGHSGTQGGRQDPGTSGGEGLSAECNTGTGRDQSCESRQPRPGQRKTAGEGDPSPVSSIPGPLAREWWGECCRARPSPGLVWLCAGGPLSGGSGVQSGGCQGDGCPLGLGAFRGLARHPDHQGSATASLSGGSAAWPRRVGHSNLSRVFHSHSASSRAGSDEAVGRWGLKSPGVESRGSSQRIQRVQAASLPPPPAEAGRGQETPPSPGWQSWPPTPAVGPGSV